MAKTTRRDFLDTSLAVAMVGAAVLAPSALRAAPAAAAVPAAAAAAPRNVMPVPSTGGDRGVTRPSNQSELAFNLPGVVAKVMVKSGDVVKAGTIVAVQDDREEQALVKSQTAKVKSAALQIRAAEMDLEKKKVDLARVEAVYGELIARGGSNSEVDEARVNVKIGEVAVEYRKGELDQEKLQLEAANVKVAQRQLVSPIDGVVARVDVHPGEGTDLAKPAGILVVQNEPLWVDANVLSSKTVNLKKGQTLHVRYADGGDWVPAQILNLAEVANAGANVRQVRLQMPNTLKREAGLQVFVKLPDAPGQPVGAPAAGQADPARAAADVAPAGR